MILDAELQLSADQAVTSTDQSTNAIDLGSAIDIGAGEPIAIDITVTETCTAAGAATVTFGVITDNAAALSSANIIMSSTSIAIADLTAGTRLRLVVPPTVPDVADQRYLGLRYTVVTGPLTAGKFTAYAQPLNRCQDAPKHYPSGFAVA